MLQGDLGGQPAPEGVADHGHVREVELSQHRDVRLRQPGDAGQPVGLWRAAEAGVGGQQHPGVGALGQQVSEAGHGHHAAATVQQQEWPGAVAVGDGDLHRTGGAGLERVSFGAGRPEGTGRDQSVEAAAARVRSEYGHLDVLINNAGTAAPRVGAEELTADAAM